MRGEGGVCDARRLCRSDGNGRSAANRHPQRRGNHLRRRFSFVEHLVNRHRPLSGTLSDGTPFSGSTSPISVTVSPVSTTIYTISTLLDANCTAIPADLSGSATVTVEADPVVSISGAADVCEGGTVMLTANVSGGTGSTTYQWKRDGNNVGTDSPTYTTDNTLVPGAYSYTVEITQASGCAAISPAVNADVVANSLVPPGINPTPASGTMVCVGDAVSATFTPGSGGTGAITETYEYSVDGGGAWNPYTPGDPITATVPMVGANMIQIRTQRTATGIGCNSSAYNTVEWSVDNVPPTVITKDITIYLNSSGTASITPGDVDDGSTDNCTIAGMSVSPNTFNCDDVNTTGGSWNAVGGAGFSPTSVGENIQIAP
ncbi:MAG: hypothetical protein IPL49_08015 [Saprospirales bacterium]|nr:hypothetical protein [Saprospirales bacterium]